MWKRISLAFKITVLVAVALAVGIINGCGKLSPVAPETEQVGLQEPFSPYEVEDKWGKVASSTQLSGVSKDIGSDGGTLNIDPDYYESDFIVPAGSVDGTMTITCQVTIYNASIGRIYIFNFGPDGSTFDPAAKLTLEMDALEDYNPNESEFTGADIYWYNSKSKTWELQESDTDIADNEVDFSIEHFSRYAIGGRTR